MGKEVMTERSKGIYPYDQIFKSAIKRLQSSSDVCGDDKASIMKLVKHLLAKGVSKPRAVKYINHKRARTIFLSTGQARAQFNISLVRK
jgi:hypothetical protein